jgi:membrane protein
MMNGKHEPDINTEEQKLSEVVQTVDTEIKPLKAFFTKFNHDWSLTLARALAYNLLTAIFPIALAMLSILGIVVGALDPHVQDDLIARLQTIFPSVISSGDVIRTILHQLSKISGVLGIIAVVLAIFTGSRLFLLIERCFNIIYRLPPRSFLSKNLVAIGMLLLFILLVPIMIFASSAPAFVLALLKNTPLGNAPGSGFFFTLVSILSSLLVAMIISSYLYDYPKPAYQFL